MWLMRDDYWLKFIVKTNEINRKKLIKKLACMLKIEIIKKWNDERVSLNYILIKWDENYFFFSFLYIFLIVVLVA
jgi:hypothetical protein